MSSSTASRSGPKASATARTPPRGIDADPEATAARERPQPGSLRSARHERIRDEQVVQAGVGEHLRLADRPDRQSGRPGSQLAAAYLDALVGLGVRAEVDAAVRHDCRHPADRRVQPIEVDDDGGRIDGLARLR